MEVINPYAVSTITPDLRGTLTYSIADAYNGVTASGGGKQVVATNTFLMGINIDHTYREYGKASITWGMISSDGTTDPVSLTSL